MFFKAIQFTDDNSEFHVLTITKDNFTMNKNELIAAVADKTDLSKAAAGEAVDAVFDAITASLKGGDEVKILGLSLINI